MSRNSRSKTPPSIHTAPSLLDAAIAAHAAGEAVQFAVLLGELTTILGRTGDLPNVRDEVLSEATKRAASRAS